MKDRIKTYRLYSIHTYSDGSISFYPVQFFHTLSGAKNSKAVKDHPHCKFVIMPCTYSEGETKYFYESGEWTNEVPNYAHRYWLRDSYSHLN